MKVLVVGEGGREHTLVWKISQSKLVEKIYCAPGNAGISSLAECVDIKANDISGLLNFAKENKIDLTVVGPEDPLVEGIVDKFEKEGLNIFGSHKNAALLEGSKVFSKELMKESGIPTADFGVFSDKDKAIEYVKGKDSGCVVKADGLAAGKGVLICKNSDEAINAVETIMGQKKFGEAGNSIVVEDFLKGEEASILAFSDGKTVKLMVSSQDHKRALDNDEGLNTGGMGAYSPAPIITKEMEEKILKEIMQPTINALSKRGHKYKGVIYAGLMIDDDNINVLEFNCRFGDPETQVVLPRLESDLVEIMFACINENLDEKEIVWSEKPATCIVLASGGYPESYEKGKKISGLAEANSLENVIVFHAGTKKENEEIVTNGGRVLGVTALGNTIKDSIDLAYVAVGKISFEQMHYRRDIGKRAIDRNL